MASAVEIQKSKQVLAVKQETGRGSRSSVRGPPKGPTPPLGRHTWILTKEPCKLFRFPELLTAAKIIEKEENKEEQSKSGPSHNEHNIGDEIELMLSNCTDSQFSCNDGSCILLSKVGSCS